MHRSTRSRSTVPARQDVLVQVEQLSEENNENVFEPGTTDERKQRHRITRAQLERLEALYKENTHPTRQVKQSLASEVGLPVKNVTIWFQNKRQNTRRKSNRFKERVERDLVPGPSDCARSTKLLLGLTPDPPSPREDSPVAEVGPYPQVQINMSAHTSASAAGSSSGSTYLPPVQDFWRYLPSSPLTPTLVHSSVDSVSPSMLLPEDDVFGPVIASIPGSGRKPDLNWACAREQVRFRTSASRSPDSSFRFGDESPACGGIDIQGPYARRQQQRDIGKSSSAAEDISTDSLVMPEYYGIFPLDMLEGASILLSLKNTGLRA